VETNFKIGLQTDHKEYYAPWSRDLLLEIWDPVNRLSLQWLKLQTSNLVHKLVTKKKKIGKRGREARSGDALLNFGPLYISATAKAANFKYDMTIEYNKCYLKTTKLGQGA